MFEKLLEIEKHFDGLSEQLQDPDVVSNQENYTKLMKEYKRLTPIVDTFRALKKAQSDENDAKELLDSGDKELKELAEEELKTAKEQIEQLSEQLKILLLPTDPNDDRNVIVEIRGGAGGEEAALFAGSLFRMYSMYAESKGWKTEIINVNETELGGYKEISFMINGEGAYSDRKSVV